MDEQLSAVVWHDEIKRYQEQFKRWTERGEEIVKRYRDERKDTTQTDARFNILWSNIQTLKPAIYARPPMPEVSRRFNDNDPIARCASTILERALDFEIKQYPDFHNTLSHVVDDRLLPGRGVAWLRYEPQIETVEEPEITNYVEVGDDAYTHETSEANSIAGDAPQPFERITNETTPVDYVYWQDFAHLPARTWDEVTWVGRRVYLSKDEGTERFGDQFLQVPLTVSPDKKDGERTTTESLKKAAVWEIWDKPKKCVYWVAEGYDRILDHKDDPLELENFFPCPKPYFATLSTGTLVPVADFIQYQDQANEIDDITGRIQHLTRALKVMGIYAADEGAVERLMKEGNDAVMIPVTNWAAFVEKGGLSNAVQFIPLGDVVGTLSQLYQAREACKQIIYEITGLSDIIRGASQAQESATAQQIKSQYASLRLGTLKDDMSRFAREVLRMKAEVMCSKYQPETLIKASGILHTSDAPLVQQAIALLQNEPMRNFNIDIETDTLVLIDEQQDKQDRIEFLTAVGGFLRQAVDAAKSNPGMTPLLGEMLMFGVRGFKIGRTMEASLEQYLQQAKQQSGQQQQSPEQIKAQADMQAKQAELQMEQAKMQAEQQLEAQKIQFEQWKVQLENDTKVIIAEMGNKNAIKQKMIDLNVLPDREAIMELNENGDLVPNVSLQSLMDTVHQNMQSILAAQNQNHEMALQNQAAQHAQLLQQLTRPKQVVRDPSTGKIIGVQ